MSINLKQTSLNLKAGMSAQDPYNPQYDPLVNANPGQGQDYAPTYWIGTAGEAPEDDGPILGDTSADVVIVGSGYTGLCAAIYLAEHYGIKATVLEANRTSWGCSTRNGGQAQCASGRLKRSQWIERWGLILHCVCTKNASMACKPLKILSKTLIVSRKLVDIFISLTVIK